MSTITHSTDMDEFMRMAGLTLPEVLETLKELAREGFVTKTKNGYAIVEKGKLALAALAWLPEDKAFHFYLKVGLPAGISARSVKEFYAVVKTVTVNSLEFHLERADFESWFKTGVRDDVFASELAALKKEGLKGETLRKQVLLGLLTRFGEDALLHEWAA
jgi:Mn-dependent DtxR family transcriptional regulator